MRGESEEAGRKRNKAHAAVIVESFVSRAVMDFSCASFMGVTLLHTVYACVCVFATERDGEMCV